jgi:hypothetical protein
MGPTTNVPAGRPVRQPLGKSGQKDADSLIQLRRAVVVRQHGRQLTEVGESAGREPVKAQPEQRHGSELCPVVLGEDVLIDNITGEYRTEVLLEAGKTAELWQTGAPRSTPGGHLDMIPRGPTAYGAAALTLSSSTVIGALLALLERYVINPTPPAACRAAVVSVTERCQLAGSAVPTSQTLARMVVVPVPVTCRRIAKRSPTA